MKFYGVSFACMLRVEQRCIWQVRDSTVDIMRLSIIVRNNLEKEAEAKEYDAASSAGAPKGDVKLHHTDAELDFEEQAADAAGPKPSPFRPILQEHCAV